MFVVVVTEKGGGKQRIEFETQAVRIGRVHGNDVVLPRSNVSKSHAAIEQGDDGFYISDAGSTNGTYVNGRRVMDRQLLKPDDRIYVGDFILTIEGTPTPAAKPESGSQHTPPPKPPAPKPPLPSPPRVTVEKTPKVPLPKGRGSLPSPPVRAAAPTEKRIPLPGHAPKIEEPATAPQRSSVPPPPPPEDMPRDGSTNLTDTVVLQAAKQLNLKDAAHGPLALDGPTAATVRSFISGAVDNLAAEGRVPEDHLPRRIKGRIYRRLVDLGPLAKWLSDPEIQKIRILSPSEIHLWREGEWRRATTPFEGGTAQLIDVAVRLAAGRLSLSPNRGQTEQFYTEEGYLAHVSPSPESPFITVDKHTVPDDEASSFGEAERTLISNAAAAGSRILVIGSNPVARRAVFLNIIGLLPADAFVAAVGDICAADLRGVQGAALDLSPVSEKSTRAVRTAVHHARSMNPDWLAVTGLPNRAVPAVLAAAAGRTAVLAELPLGGPGRLDRELAVALAACGLSMTASEAAVHLKECFDVVAVAESAPDGRGCIHALFGAGLSDAGEWRPSPLFTREIPR